jgi:predicted neuraminidase
MADQRPTYWSTADRKTSISVAYWKDSGIYSFVVFTDGRIAQMCSTANEAAKAIKWPANLPSGAAAREFLAHWGYVPPVKKQPTPEPNDNTKTII